MVVNWRGQIEAGVRMADPVQIVDWMPTLCALAGATPKQDPRWDGQDITGQLFGTATKPEPRSLFWNFRGGRHLAARVGDWKLIRRLPDTGGPETELFHIADDPYETQEVSGDHPHVVSQLQTILDDQRQLDDTSKRNDVASPLMP